MLLTIINIEVRSFCQDLVYFSVKPCVKSVNTMITYYADDAHFNYIMLLTIINIEVKHYSRPLFLPTCCCHIE